ncbi:unnamed protein product [Blepharisma stoltei]|uniref:Uncharacterized protein n=1 Tax=Blepharisma stoltei TaxID=1481888 RepID=A0AAU9JWE8_9CILI|nr:unnamed protein product [Blepharisma stoltei]
MEKYLPVSISDATRSNTNSSSKLSSSHIQIHPNKGIQMHALIQARKHLDNQVLLLQNRIKHLETERCRSERTIELAKTMTKKRQEVRKKANDDKDLQTQKKINSTKDLDNKKRIVSEEREKRKESLMQTKQKLFLEKKRASSSVKNEKMMNESVRKEKEELNQSITKNKAERILSEFRKKKEIQEERAKKLKLEAELKYIKRIEDETNYQENVKQKIKELESLEEELKKSLKQTLLKKESVMKQMGSHSLNSTFYSQNWFSHSPLKRPYIATPNPEEQFLDEISINYIEYVPFDVTDIANDESFVLTN